MPLPSLAASASAPALPTFAATSGEGVRRAARLESGANINAGAAPRTLPPTPAPPVSAAPAATELQGYVWLHRRARGRRRTSHREPEPASPWVKVWAIADIPNQSLLLMLGADTDAVDLRNGARAVYHGPEKPRQSIAARAAAPAAATEYVVDVKTAAGATTTVAFSDRAVALEWMRALNACAAGERHQVKEVVRKERAVTKEVTQASAADKASDAAAARARKRAAKAAAAAQTLRLEARARIRAEAKAVARRRLDARRVWGSDERAATAVQAVARGNAQRRLYPRLRRRGMWIMAGRQAAAHRRWEWALRAVQRPWRRAAERAVTRRRYRRGAAVAYGALAAEAEFDLEDAVAALGEVDGSPEGAAVEKRRAAAVGFSTCCRTTAARVAAALEATLGDDATDPAVAAKTAAFIELLERVSADVDAVAEVTGIAVARRAVADLFDGDLAEHDDPDADAPATPSPRARAEPRLLLQVTVRDRAAAALSPPPAAVGRSFADRAVRAPATRDVLLPAHARRVDECIDGVHRLGRERGWRVDRGHLLSMHTYAEELHCLIGDAYATTAAAAAAAAASNAHPGAAADASDRAFEALAAGPRASYARRVTATEFVCGSGSGSGSGPATATSDHPRVWLARLRLARLDLRSRYRMGAAAQVVASAGVAQRAALIVARLLRRAKAGIERPPQNLDDAEAYCLASAWLATVLPARRASLRKTVDTWRKYVKHEIKWRHLARRVYVRELAVVMRLDVPYRKRAGRRALEALQAAAVRRRRTRAPLAVADAYRFRVVAVRALRVLEERSGASSAKTRASTAALAAARRRRWLLYWRRAALLAKSASNTRRRKMRWVWHGWRTLAPALGLRRKSATLAQARVRGWLARLTHRRFLDEATASFSDAAFESQGAAPCCFAALSLQAPLVCVAAGAQSWTFDEVLALLDAGSHAGSGFSALRPGGPLRAPELLARLAELSAPLLPELAVPTASGVSQRVPPGAPLPAAALAAAMPRRTPAPATGVALDAAASAVASVLAVATARFGAARASFAAAPAPDGRALVRAAAGAREARLARGAAEGRAALPAAVAALDADVCGVAGAAAEALRAMGAAAAAADELAEASAAPLDYVWKEMAKLCHDEDRLRGQDSGLTADGRWLFRSALAETRHALMYLRSELLDAVQRARACGSELRRRAAAVRKRVKVLEWVVAAAAAKRRADVARDAKAGGYADRLAVRLHAAGVADLSVAASGDHAWRGATARDRRRLAHPWRRLLEVRHRAAAAALAAVDGQRAAVVAETAWLAKAGAEATAHLEAVRAPIDATFDADVGILVGRHLAKVEAIVGSASKSRYQEALAVTEEAYRPKTPPPVVPKGPKVFKVPASYDMMLRLKASIPKRPPTLDDRWRALLRTTAEVHEKVSRVEEMIKVRKDTQVKRSQKAKFELWRMLVDRFREAAMNHDFTPVSDKLGQWPDRIRVVKKIMEETLEQSAPEHKGVAECETLWESQIVPKFVTLKRDLDASGILNRRKVAKKKKRAWGLQKKKKKKRGRRRSSVFGGDGGEAAESKAGGLLGKLHNWRNAKAIAAKKRAREKVLEDVIVKAGKVDFYMLVMALRDLDAGDKEARCARTVQRLYRARLLTKKAARAVMVQRVVMVQCKYRAWRAFRETKATRIQKWYRAEKLLVMLRRNARAVRRGKAMIKREAAIREAKALYTYDKIVDGDDDDPDSAVLGYANRFSGHFAPHKPHLCEAYAFPTPKQRKRETRLKATGHRETRNEVESGHVIGRFFKAVVLVENAAGYRPTQELRWSERGRKWRRRRRGLPPLTFNLAAAILQGAARGWAWRARERADLDRHRAACVLLRMDVNVGPR